MENSELSSYAIGIFDSGFGGLTVMRAVRSLLPKENILYLGDAARLPYGNKSRETIIRYTLESGRFLADKKIKLLIVACHTASSLAIDVLSEDLPIPVLGMVSPSLPELLSAAEQGKIGILGTQATISSEVYQKAITTRVAKAEIAAVACPLFVPLVEEGFIDHSITSQAIHHYLAPLKEQQVTTVLLACTHYPLLQQDIQQYLGACCNLIDPGVSCAKHVQEILETQNLMNKNATGSSTFYTTDDPEKFRRLGEKFLGSPISQVTHIKL